MSREESLIQIAETLDNLCSDSSVVFEIAKTIDPAMQISKDQHALSIWKTLLREVAENPQEIANMLSYIPARYATDPDLLNNLLAQVESYAQTFRPLDAKVIPRGAAFHLKPVPHRNHPKKAALFTPNAARRIDGGDNIMKLLLQVGPDWAAHDSDMRLARDLINVARFHLLLSAASLSKSQMPNRERIMLEANRARSLLEKMKVVAEGSIELNALSPSDRQSQALSPLSIALKCKLSYTQDSAVLADSFIEAMEDFEGHFHQIDRSALYYESMLEKLVKLGGIAHEIYEIFQKTIEARASRGVTAFKDCIINANHDVDILVEGLTPKISDRGSSPALWMKAGVS